MKRRYRALRGALLATALATAVPVAVADFRATADPAVMYDAPSTKARAMFVFGRDTPLEVVVALDGWTKVRDSAGTIGWIEQKALTERRALVVATPQADVRAEPENAAAVVFVAEQGVLLELAETAAAANATASPGWVKVRHRDGPTGYIRIAQVFGL